MKTKELIEAAKAALTQAHVVALDECPACVEEIADAIEVLDAALVWLNAQAASITDSSPDHTLHTTRANCSTYRTNL